MKHSRLSAGILIVALAIPLGFLSPAMAQGTEVEPNNSPDNPQDLGAVTLPFTLTGSLDTPPDVPDIDRFRLSVPLMTRVRIDVEGTSTGAGSLSDPYVLVGTGQGWYLMSDDDGGTGLNAVIRLTLLESGVVNISVTGFGDSNFNGEGTSSGTYRLTVMAIPAPSSVSGRAVDAASGDAINGMSAYSWVDLRRCDDLSCKAVVGGTNLDAEGRFRFDMRSLDAGRYQIATRVPGYRSAESDPFILSDREDRDLGDVVLQPLPHIGSISGRIVDSQTGQPVQAWVDLVQCRAGDCNTWVMRQPADTEGRFRFERNWNGVPLGIGTYRVWVTWNSYVETTTEPFQISEGESRDLGDILLQPLPHIGSIGGQVVDSFTGLPIVGASVELRKCEEWGCNGWGMNSQLSDAQGRFRFERTAWGEFIPPGSYQIVVWANYYNYLQFGPFTVADGEQRDLGAVPLDAWPRVGSISGRIVDSETGEPVSASVQLVMWCDWGECGWPASQVSGPDGRFRFDRSDWGGFLDVGTYRLRVSADNHEPGQTEPFAVGNRENRDVGNVPLVRIKLIRSLSGRVVDAIDGQPLRGDADPWTWVWLLRCDESGSCEYLGSQSADADGRYRFDRSNATGLLRVGNYEVHAVASQYEEWDPEPISVAEHEDRDVGDLRLDPYPVQFKDIHPCVSIPSAGGTCDYSVTIRAGQNTRLRGQAWSIVDIWGGEFYGSTHFQAGTNDARVPIFEKVKLDPGQSGSLHFKFTVPSSVRDGAWVCATAWVGQEPDPVYQPLGYRSLFCVVKGPSGFPLVPDRKVQEAYRKLKDLDLSK